MEEKVYFRHSLFVKGKPRVTVAGVITGDTMKIGVARCSHRDSFVKKKGRYIAEARARKSPLASVTLPEDRTKLGKFFYEVAEELIPQVIETKAVH